MEITPGDIPPGDYGGRIGSGVRVSSSFLNPRGVLSHGSKKGVCTLRELFTFLGIIRPMFYHKDPTY